MSPHCLVKYLCSKNRRRKQTLCAVADACLTNSDDNVGTGVNPAADTSPNILVGGDVNENIPPILLRTFGYSRPILVAVRSLSLKPFSFGCKTGVPLPHPSPFAGSSPPTLNSR